jgi:hypothetical protein
VCDNRASSDCLLSALFLAELNQLFENGHVLVGKLTLVKMLAKFLQLPIVVGHHRSLLFDFLARLDELVTA